MKFFINLFLFIIIQNICSNKEPTSQNITHFYYKMEKGIEQKFTNLISSNIYHYSLPVDRNDKVDIQIKLGLEYNINDIKMSYIADTSTKPPSKIEDEGEINLDEKTANSFLNIKGSYIVTKPFIYYVSFLFEPKKNIDIVYITLQRKQH